MLAAAALAAAAAIATPATAQVTITGTATPTVVHDSGDGLLIQASSSGVFNAGPLDLDGSTPTPSSAFVGNLFTIGTPEGSVELGEDTMLLPISVLFTFTNPLDAAAGTISGQTFGYYTLSLFGSCGAFAGGCGAVHWDGPTTFNFGDGGTFSLALDDVSFTTPGSSHVGGTFTLLTPSVPEPATWAMMLLGFGAVGFALRRQKAPLPQLA